MCTLKVTFMGIISHLERENVLRKVLHVMVASGFFKEAKLSYIISILLGCVPKGSCAGSLAPRVVVLSWWGLWDVGPDRG